MLEREVVSLVEVSECCAIVHNQLVELRLRGELGDALDASRRQVRSEDPVPEFADMPSSVEGNAEATDSVSVTKSDANTSIDVTIERLIGTTAFNGQKRPC